MADVQPNRAMPVHRDMLPALCNAGLTHNELRCALAILRASWGWSTTTTTHRLSQTVLMRLTGIQSRTRIRSALCGLEAKGVARRVSAHSVKGNPAEWQIVKDYDQWQTPPDVLWRQASGARPVVEARPGVENRPEVGTSTDPEPTSGQGALATRGVCAPATQGVCALPTRHEAQVEAQVETQVEAQAGDAPAQPAARAKRTVAQIRAEQAEQLVAQWYELSGTKRDKKSRADRLRIECAVRVIKDHGYEAIRDDLHALANDPWWRGRNRDGGDVFKDRGPTSFWGKGKRDTVTVRLDERARGVRQLDSSAGQAQSQPEPTRTYQSWSWFETELRAEARRASLKPHEVTEQWAKGHKEWSRVPRWVFDRAVEATREDRNARF